MSMNPEALPARLLNDPWGMTPRANRLLAALPAEQLQDWLPVLRPMRVERGRILPGHQVFFPTTATLSLYACTRDGHAAEVGTIGNEGMVGLELLGGQGPASAQAEVTTSGGVYALGGSTFRNDFKRAGAVMELILRYAHWHTTQLMHRAVCAHHHTVEQRMCRCLLDSLDRGHGSATIELTHQSLAARLGVRRESVSACAQRLQAAGTITYQRGCITVNDSASLRAGSCACYAAARSTYERGLPGPEPADEALAPARAGPPDLVMDFGPLVATAAAAVAGARPSSQGGVSP